MTLSTRTKNSKRYKERIKLKNRCKYCSIRLDKIPPNEIKVLTNLETQFCSVQCLKTYARMENG